MMYIIHFFLKEYMVINLSYLLRGHLEVQVPLSLNDGSLVWFV